MRAIRDPASRANTAAGISPGSVRGNDKRLLRIVLNCNRVLPQTPSVTVLTIASDPTNDEPTASPLLLAAGPGDCLRPRPRRTRPGPRPRPGQVAGPPDRGRQRRSRPGKRPLGRLR